MAKARREAPSESYIRSLAAALEVEYQAQDTQIDVMREVRELERHVSIPDELKRVEVEILDPTVTDEIARVVATLSLNFPRCEVTPASESDTAQTNATLREDWSRETLYSAGKSEYGDHALRAALDAMVGDGGGWVKLLFTKDTWEERYKLKLKDFADDTEETDEGEPVITKSAAVKFDEATEEAKRGAGPPFRLLNVDTRTVYPVWDGTHLPEVVEKSERRTLPLMRKYGLSADREGRLVQTGLGPPLSEVEGNKLGNTLTFYEYWDDEWCVYYVRGPQNGVTVRSFRHGYGRVPYFFAPGLMLNHWKGRKVGWSVSQNKRWLVEMRAFLLTLLAQSAAQDIGAPLQRITNDPVGGYQGEDNRPDGPETWQLNAIYENPPGTTLAPIFPHAVTPSFDKLLALINTMIDRVDSPRVASQIGGGVEGAGFAISQILTEAKTKHSPFIVHFEAMLEELTRFLWFLVREKVGEKVWVQEAYSSDKRASWLGVGPNELKAAVGMRWHLDPEQPSAKLVEARVVHERLKAGTVNMDRAITMLGDNPDEVRRGKMLDEIRNEEWYRAWFRKEMLAEVGMGDLDQLADQVARSGQMPAAPGGPPGQMIPEAMGGGGPVPMQGQPQGAPGGPAGPPVRPMVNPPGTVVPQAGAMAGVMGR